MGLTERDKSFSNPFALSDHVQQVLRDQAEQAGSRAIDWNMSLFDWVGGPNTLRTVWASLKSEDRTVGVKRDAETSDETDSDSDSTSSTKRARRSLGISSTCDKLEAVGIASNSE